jgi:hypothetical protein
MARAYLIITACLLFGCAPSLEQIEGQYLGVVNSDVLVAIENSGACSYHLLGNNDTLLESYFFFTELHDGILLLPPYELNQRKLGGRYKVLKLNNIFSLQSMSGTDSGTIAYKWKYPNPGKY